MIQVFLFVFMSLSVPLLLKCIRSLRTIPMALLFLFEIIILLDLWTVIVLPCSYLEKKLSVAVYIFLLAFSLIYVVLLLNGLKNKECLEGVIKSISHFNNSYKWQFLILLIIIGYQVCRCAFFQTIAYSDSKTYIAIINDMLDTNRFYLLNDLDGNIVTDISKVSPKYSLTAWYSFEAAISFILRLHPLIVVNTILPPIIMMFSYVSLWFFSSLFFMKQVGKRITFLISIALFYQFLNDDASIYFMIWPTWGKNIVMSIMLPLFVYLSYTKEIDDCINRCIIFLVSFAACFTSTMGVVIMPMTCVIISLTEIIIRKKINIQNILNIVPVFTPVVIYVFLYVIW